MQLPEEHRGLQVIFQPVPTESACCLPVETMATTGRPLAGPSGVEPPTFPLSGCVRRCSHEDAETGTIASPPGYAELHELLSEAGEPRLDFTTHATPP